MTTLLIFFAGIISAPVLWPIVKILIFLIGLAGTIFIGLMLIQELDRNKP